jgi:hypothetical protein
MNALVRWLVGPIVRHQIDQLTRERDMWKANHDNQVALKRCLMDRPDLQSRAASMQALIRRATRAETLCEEYREATEDFTYFKTIRDLHEKTRALR